MHASAHGLGLGGGECSGKKGVQYGTFAVHSGWLGLARERAFLLELRSLLYVLFSFSFFCPCRNNEGCSRREAYGSVDISILISSVMLYIILYSTAAAVLTPI